MSFKKLPVFLFPNSLKFYLESKSSHKQVLSLYNPYDFTVRFKVLCTSPKKYVVIDPEGSIGPRMMVDIVVRHISPQPDNCNITDKFRITMQDQAKTQILGTKVIEATLFQEDEDTTLNEADFQNIPFPGRGASDEQRLCLTNRSLPATQSGSKSIYFMTAFAFMGLLLLPTEHDVPGNSIVPPYLHIRVHIKLAIAYILGLISAVIIRP